MNRHPSRLSTHHPLTPNLTTAPLRHCALHPTPNKGAPIARLHPSLRLRLCWLLSCCILSFCIPTQAMAGDWPTHGPGQSKGGLELSPKTNLKIVRQKLRPRRIALVIGISKYHHRAWNDLRYPAKDALRFRRFLMKQGKFDEVMLLNQPKQTRLKGIRSAIQWLKQRVRSEQDTVLIYVSGHGSIAQPRPQSPLERYLVASDSDKDLPKTGLSILELKQMMEQLISRRKALILATCYVGTQASLERQEGGIKAIPSGVKGTYQLGAVSRTTLILSATGYMQPAYEVEALEGDVYTHFLLQCARAAHQNSTQKTGTAIHRCATAKTYKYVRSQLKREQTPSIESKIMGKDTFYLLPPTLPENHKGTPTERPHGWLKVLQKKFKRLSFRPKGSKGAQQDVQLRSSPNAGSLTLRLPEGQYLLTLTTADGRHVQRKVEIVAGTHRQLNTDGDLEDLNDPNDDTPSLPQDWEGGGFLSFGPDLQPEKQTLFGLRAGIWTKFVGVSIFLGGGTGVDQQNKPIDDILIRIGIPIQVGYTFHLGRFDIFLNALGEIGLWTAREARQEMVFYAAYGPNVRFRWWFARKVALRLSIGLLFTYSPDRASAQSEFPSQDNFQWTHRAHLSFSVGFDFSGKAIW